MRQQGWGFYWVKIIMILAIAGAGFFYGQKTMAGQNILISEVQIGGAMANDEFVELYNPTGQDINLADFSLKKKTPAGTESNLVNSAKFSGVIPAYGFFLIAHQNYKTAINADLAYSGASYYISADNTILLYNASDNLLDKVGYGAASVFETRAMSQPDNGKSLARKISANVMQDTENNYADFEVKNIPTPQNANSPKLIPAGNQTNSQNTATSTDLTLPSPSPGEGNNAASSTTPLNPPLSGGTDTLPLPGGQKINFGDVVINELVSDPADNEVEWVELYNKSGKEIDLTGWRLEEGSGAKTKLDGILTANGANRYKVIDKPAGNLNNNGDLIVLYDSSGKIIDQIAYGNWADGQTANNAFTASDPNSLARKFDGYNTFNNANDFAVTIRPTKGASNIIETEDEVSAEAKAKFDFSSDIYLSEILPNPAGDDTNLEFIEIYNAGRREINLTGWSLSNEDDKKVNLEKITASAIIKAGEYLAFFRPRSKIILHNDQGQVKLFQPLADKPLSVVDYKNVREGWSYNLKNPPNPLPARTTGVQSGGYQGDEWGWSETLTPGSANVIKAVNHAPEVNFSFPKKILTGTPVIFDGSDTVDQDGDELKYSWDFGDGLKNNLANPEHTYLKIGIFKVKLAVSDGKETTKKEKSVKVISSVGEMINVSETILNAEIPLNPPSRPNDCQPDKVILAGCRPVGRVLKGVIINEIFPNPAGADTGQEWLEIKNQSAAEIDLLNWRVENSNGKYKFKSEQLLESDAFYVLDNAKSRLAFKNSSDIINLYNDLDELADTVEYADAVQGESYAKGANGNWFWTTAITPGAENIIKVADSEVSIKYQASIAKAKAENYVETNLEKIKELDIGSLVIVKGTVAVEPGILGAQIFYIVGSPGLQVYNYKKDFPALKIGDYIEVAGELTQAQGEFRIKTKDKSGIKIAGRKPPPLALAVKGDEVSEENISQLIIITGEITDKKSASLYVDDGSDEIFVYIKKNTGISTKGLTVGQNIAVSGILSKTKTGLRLLPRYQSDIVKLNQTDALEPQVLGEVATAGEWELAERNKKLELFKYLLIIAGGVIIILGILFIKIKRKSL